MRRWVDISGLVPFPPAGQTGRPGEPNDTSQFGCGGGERVDSAGQGQQRHDSAVVGGWCSVAQGRGRFAVVWAWDWVDLIRLYSRMVYSEAAEVFSV